MSYWTYIRGVIDVEPIGRAQPEKRYILDTILEHLPEVTGSERNMHVDVIQKDGYNCSSSCNEFGEWIPGRNNETSDTYHIIINGDLRDRMFEETLRELSKWLNRLAKRTNVSDICIKLTGYKAKSYGYKSTTLVISDPEPYKQMAEWPSWCEESHGEPAWAEYLMWESAKNSWYPMMLAYKYYDDPENDAEVERRMAYKNSMRLTLKLRRKRRNYNL